MRIEMNKMCKNRLKYNESRLLKPIGYCEKCDYLWWVSKELCKCTWSEKLIIPEFPPYTKSNPTCEDFKKYEKVEQKEDETDD